MAVDREQLIGGLRALRQGRGLTMSALEPQAAVRGLLGDIDLERQYHQLVEAIKQIGDDAKAMALRSAYGVEPGLAHTLTKRREQFAATTKISTRTVINWEDGMIGALADALLNRTEYRGDLLKVSVHVDVVDCIVKGLWYEYTYSVAGELAPETEIYKNPKSNWMQFPVHIKWPGLQVLVVDFHFPMGRRPDCFYQLRFETLDDWTVNTPRDWLKWEPVYEHSQVRIAQPDYQHYYVFTWTYPVVAEDAESVDSQ